MAERISQAPPGQVEFLVAIGPGMRPGQGVQTTTPDGQLLTFYLPPDYVEGQVIPVYYTPLPGKSVPSGAEPGEKPSVLSKAETRALFRTFKDAKDKWKIDALTMKGFYLHTESGYLYTWDQAKGVLYEYEQLSGNCQAVWSSAVPALNAEIWKVLPLPPTDPAAMQAQQLASGFVASPDVYMVLTVAHEGGKQLPKDVLESAMESFASKNELEAGARHKIQQLPAAGQHFVIQNFRCPEGVKPTKALVEYVDKILKRPRTPWGKNACTLIVPSAGATLGRCCPDLDALCREDAAERLAQAHCNIMSEQDRFFVRDLNTTVEGTLLDGFPVNDDWVGPLTTGSLLILGPLRIKIQLSEMAQDTPLPTGKPLKRAADEDTSWTRKVYQKTAEDDKANAARQAKEYKDRAEERRARSQGEAGGAAIDGLLRKYEEVRKAEKMAEEAEERRVEMPTLQAHREANMSIDGTFLGMGGLERAGIGFASHSSSNAEIIPDVLDPKSLSPQEAARLKTQKRFQQATGQ